MKNNFLLFITLFIGIIISSISLKAQHYLDATTFQSHLKDSSKKILIDVRTPSEYKEAHIENAINIDFKNPNFITRVDSLDHSTPLFIYCLSGSRSKSAIEVLKKEGFNNLNQLDGGLMAWNNQHLPVEIKEDSTQKDAFTINDLQEIVHTHHRVLVDFNAPWCGPCLVLAPKIKKIEKEWSDRLFVQRINVDKSPALTESMQIRSIPILILFEDGKPLRALEGNHSLKEIRNFLE